MGRFSFCDFVKAREELRTCERSESFINCLSSLNEEQFDQTFRKFAREEFKLKGVVITESPNIEIDSMLLKKEWGKL